MKIIFFGYSGVHSAVIAAAAHSGRLSACGAAQLQLTEVPFFGSRKVKYQISFLGEDQMGNQIYALGTGWEIQLIPRAIKSFLDLLHVRPNEIILVNTIIPLGRLSRWGELLSCKGLRLMGNYLALKGLTRDYAGLVKHIRAELDRALSIDFMSGMKDNNGEIRESGESL